MLLVLGDVMTDVYVHGAVERISPDAPVPVLTRTRRTRRMSGACISARAAREACGTAVTLGSVTGDDESAEFLGTSLREAGVSPQITTVPGCPTISKTRFLTGSHHLLRVDEDGRFHDHAQPVEDHMLGVWRSVRDSVSAVLFSDYVKGTLPAAVIREVVADARARGILVVVDSKRRDMSVYTGAHAWTPNEGELALASGQDDLRSGVDRMRSSLRLDVLIVTRAGDGAVVTTNDGAHEIPTPPVGEVRSVAGAGDIFAGVLTAAAAQGLSWNDAAKTGVDHATRYVGQHPTEVRQEHRG